MFVWNDLYAFLLENPRNVVIGISILLTALLVVMRFMKWILRKPVSFRNKHVFITGGSKGLGKAFAKRVAKEGARVTIIARNIDDLQNAKKEIENCCTHESQKVLAISADVTNVEDITKAVNKAIEQSGVTDCVVICAGSSTPGLMLDTPCSVYREQIELNYLGAVYAIKACLPSMIQRGTGGSLVLVSSAAALISFAGYSQYCPSKWAMRALGDALCNEMQLYSGGITVHQFYPSNIDTTGYAHEQLTKPEPTRVIEGTALLLSPEQTAEDLFRGLCAGNFHITQEWLIEASRIGMNSTTPRNHFFLEWFLTPFLVPIQQIFMLYMNYVVRKYRNTLGRPQQHEQSEKTKRQ